MNNRSSSTPSTNSTRTIWRGALIWTLAIQFFIAQAIVQAAWTTPFSLSANYISDLGNTSCGPYPIDSNMYVCSPWHAWMNASFIVQGVIILAGIALISGAFPAGRARTIGMALLALAGPGSILVGLFPENVNITPHTIGAAAHFVSGNLGIAVLGTALAATRRRLALFSLASGLVGLLATALFISGNYLSLGIGGMERVAAYPLPLWLIVAGAVMLRRSVPNRR